MANNLQPFSIDGETFPNIRVIDLEQTFEILDGENAGRVLSGEMTRDVIGTYYNYNLKLKPEYSREGMIQYNRLWEICSAPVDFHTIVVPYDVGGVQKSTLSFAAYITSGKRQMLKYNLNNVDYWKEGSFQFIALAPRRTPIVSSAGG